MAITNGTFDTNLSGWTISGTGPYSVIWSSGRAQLSTDGISSAKISQTFTISNNTIGYGYTASGAIWDTFNIKLVVGSTTIFDNSTSLDTGVSFSAGVTPYIGQVATISFTVTRSSGSGYSYMWVDNVFDAARANALFTSSPSGARIYVDDVDMGATTPGEIVFLSSGSHTYKLTKTGYFNATGSFAVTTGQTTIISPSLSLAPQNTIIASANQKWSDDAEKCINLSGTIQTSKHIPAFGVNGSIRVSYEYTWYGYISYPAGIYLAYNGVVISGSSPIIGDYEYNDGTWRSFVADVNINEPYGADGFQVVFYADYVEEGDFCLRNARLYYDITGAPTGSASFTSSPSGARIWIDNVDKGVNTPNTISDLSAGSHNYTLKLAGYQDTTGSFSVTAGSTTTVPLVTFPASTYFTSTPIGATIWIDDTNLGVVTPATVVGLTAGSHTYRLIKIGYTNRGNFSTTAGQTTNVSAILTAVGLNGSIWVEDQYICYINASNIVTYVVGTSSGAVAGLSGSTWIEGTQLAYIDASNNKRLLPATSLGTVVGLNGSLWIDGNYLYYIANGIQRYITL